MGGGYYASGAAVTEDELRAIVGRATLTQNHDTCMRDILALVAEVRRLRQVEASRDVAAYAFQPGTRTLSDGTAITDQAHPLSAIRGWTVADLHRAARTAIGGLSTARMLEVARNIRAYCTEANCGWRSLVTDEHDPTEIEGSPCPKCGVSITVLRT